MRLEYPTRADRIARLENIHACALAANRDLTDAENSEWQKLRQELDMPEVRTTPAQPDPKTLRRADNPSAAIITKPRSYSVIRAIGGVLLNDPNIGDAGLEREIHVELCRSKAYKGVAVPISAFLKTANGQDSLTTTPGGALAVTDQLMADLLADVESAILKATILGALGVNVIAVPNAQAIRVPIKTGRSQAQWIARDGSGTVVDLTFDDLPAEAHSLAIAARMNRSSLVGYTPALESIVRQDLADSYTDAVNDALLNGSGSANEPSGLVKILTDATRDFTGELNTNVDLAVFTAFLNDHIASYAEAGPNRRWLLHPDVVLAITCSPVWAGALAPISDGRTLAGLPLVSSFRAATTSTPYAVVGDWGQAFMIQFGSALDLMGNPYADSVFMAGGMLIRGIADCDFLFRDAKRFAMASDAQATASVPGP